jgi:hypothetical protein
MSFPFFDFGSERRTNASSSPEPPKQESLLPQQREI